MKPYGTIYQITNSINGKVYIGQTVRSLKNRFRYHAGKAGKHSGKTAIGQAIQKYGADHFTIKAIFVAFTAHDLDWAEDYFIRDCNTLSPDGYNLKTGGHVLHRYSDDLKRQCRIVQRKLNGRAVIALNLLTGQEKQYEAIAATIEDGFCPSMVNEIVLSLRGKTVHKGHTFKYIDGSYPIIDPNRKTCIRRSFIRSDGSTYVQYESTRQLLDNGFDPSAVVRCCRDKQHTHKGYYWKYAN